MSYSSLRVATIRRCALTHSCLIFRVYNLFTLHYNGHMIDLIQRHQQEIADICRRQGIQRLDVFGSAATGQFDAQSSDVDFIAEFDDQSPIGGLLDRYLELATRLEALLGIAVDIITPRSMRNPYFRESVNASRETVYAA